MHQATFTQKQGRPLFVVRSSRPETNLNMLGAETLEKTHGAVPIFTARESVEVAESVAKQTEGIQETFHW